MLRVLVSLICAYFNHIQVVVLAAITLKKKKISHELKSTPDPCCCILE